MFSWEPAERSNDQSAAALRPSGLVLMVPALRGASGNPGTPECFLGEVDDILAARAHLAQRADVDPARIYLGGHSTGGTLVLLAAASTDQFRAVFALGPVADPRQYGSSGCLPDGKPAAEYVARAGAHRRPRPRPRAASTSGRRSSTSSGAQTRRSVAMGWPRGMSSSRRDRVTAP